MKRLNIILFITIVTFSLASCGSGDDNGDGSTSNKNINANTTDKGPEMTRLEFPHLKSGNNIVIVHSTADYGINYSVEWDCDKKSQRWSCYEMYNSNSVTHTSRYYSDTNQYPQDDAIPAQYRFTSDPFWGTGYDHGHICPSADRLCSAEANYQTFFLSNMQPQVNGFNAKVWANMESQVRVWNKGSFRDTLYVCKGGTIDKADQIITKTSKGLIVPKYFFMAILCKNKTGYKALAFWIEHKANADTDLAKYVISIDELEEKTGIDFFCNLPDDIENKVEKVSKENIVKVWGL
jgi:endonuclease G